jgi:branched-chain amino acid transport system substrate-binding protein
MKPRVLLLVTVAMTAVASCGGGSSSTPTTLASAVTSTSAPPTTGPSVTAASTSDVTTTVVETTVAPTTTTPASPLVIGVLVEQSGAGARSQGLAGPAAVAWGRWVNANGGLNGQPVDVEVADTGGDAGVAAHALQGVLARGAAYIVLASTSVERSIAPALSASGVAVSGVGLDVQVWGGRLPGASAATPAAPNVFPIAPSSTGLVAGQGGAAQAVSAHTFGVMACTDNTSACATSAEAYRGALPAGITFAGAQSVSSSAPNFTAECDVIFQQQVDFLQVPDPLAQRMIDNCSSRGYRGWFGVSGAVADLSLTANPGAKIAGALPTFPWWVNAAPVQEFRDVMTRYGADTFGSPTVTGVYAALQLLRRAVSTAPGPASRQSVLAGIESINGENLGGLLPQAVSFRPGTNASPVDCSFAYTLEGGTYRALPGGLSAQCPGRTSG